MAEANGNKKRRKKSAPGFYSAPAAAPANYNAPAAAMPSGGPGMHMQQFGTGYQAMEQRFVLSPPVASDLEEATRNAVPPTPSLIGLALNELSQYLATESPERPYSDVVIIAHMRSRGYQITRTDVRFGRALLNNESD